MQLFQIKNYPKQSWMLVLLTLVLFVFFHYDYFLFSFQIALGALVLPFILKPSSSHSHRYFYLLVSLVFLALGLLLQLQVFLFLSWGCLLVFVIENTFGKLGYLPLFFLLSISPALYYVVQVFSFPIRLLLSEYTCKILQLAGMKITFKGSYFMLADGVPFHIDQACVGLKMYGTGFIAATLILAYHEKNKNGKFGIGQLILAFIFMAFLLLLTNFVRIITLVMFHSLPGTISHELIGIFSLLVYSLLPFYWGSKWLNVKVKSQQDLDKKMKAIYVLMLLILWSACSFAFGLIRKESRRDEALEKLTITGFSKTEKEDGVMEFRNDSLLFYIKPAIRPFEGGHPPQICWRASGFDLCDFNERQMNGNSFMMGTLKKGDKYQYTAWWYDNGQTRTIHEWEWRKRSAKPFRVINVIALDTLTLINAVEHFQKLNLVQTEPK